MIIRIVKLTVESGKLSEFLLCFEDVKSDIRSFPGCTRLELLDEVGATGVLFTYSYWDSPAHLEDYLNSGLFKSTWARVKPLFSAKAEAWSLTRLQEIEM